MSSSDDEDKDGDNNEEGVLWDFVTRDIRPFHDKKKRVQEKKSVKKKKGSFLVSVHSVPSPVSTVSPVVKNTLSGRETDGRTAQRMQRGKMPIEARLDLHSLTQDEARTQLEIFITRSHEQGRRHVLVITGKGSRGKKNEEEWWEPSPGVLKRRVPDWLNEKPLREIVLQFHEAQPQHGGDGALYVLLRRRR